MRAAPSTTFITLITSAKEYIQLSVFSLPLPTLCPNILLSTVLQTSPIYIRPLTSGMPNFTPTRNNT